jgi:hypothetical protein
MSSETDLLRNQAIQTNKIKEITHGDNGNVMKNCKIVEAVADIFSVNSKSCTGFSPRSRYKILNEGQVQSLWDTLASMTYPQFLLIWLKIPIRT